MQIEPSDIRNPLASKDSDIDIAHGGPFTLRRRPKPIHGHETVERTPQLLDDDTILPIEFRGHAVSICTPA